MLENLKFPLQNIFIKNNLRRIKMKILKKEEYNNLLMRNKQILLLKAKIDKINILIEQYEHGKNIYTVMRDIKETVKEV